MSDQQGRFITLEGVEGAGKSSALELIADEIRDHGVPLQITREPGGTPLGEQIRDLLLDHRQREMADDTETLLVFAARAQHLHQVILPSLAAGTWVLSDRFTDATYAYQGAGRGGDIARITQLENWVHPGFTPDLTLLLDLPVELGLQRASMRGIPDRFEREPAAFFQTVRDCYLERAASAPNRFRVIDASSPLDQVQETLRQTLHEWLATV
ncbi:MAG: dTMP kinase [Ectothiorhodospiraceae bacterium]|nr:dTMP kinase [Ectothiorhodospiraceae bacterium]